MPIKKSQLYSTLWASCDALRGGMDASQYKDYVLVLLFMKYVSDKYAGQKDALLDVPKGAGFADMIALKGDKEIGDKINKIITKLAEANDLRGVIDVADFNDANKLGSGREMVERLSNLIALFDNPALDFRFNRADGDDLLGDAYEYLMRHFATESGKSKGQFYTPAEVSRIMAKIVGVGGAKNGNQTIYDPTCGSGSLLLKAHDEAKAETGFDLAIYGQEMDNATAALAKMNMILHDCPAAAPDIWRGNTLAAPYHKEKDGSLKRFDFVVANPPFSAKAWSTGFDPANDEFDRFPYGLPPPKNGDFAFLLQILASLKSTGKGVCVMPHGVLFRGAAEATIRREIVRQGLIEGIIGLPANLFYGTSIPACLVVLDKENAAGRTGIFMIDASKAFIKDGNKNRLRSQDIHKIVDIFTRQIELPRYSRMVPQTEIEANNFNLNIPRYIDSSESEDLQDIEAHLKGGIPIRDIDAFSSYWQVLPTVRTALFKRSDRPNYCQLSVDIKDIKSSILGHAEFAGFTKRVAELFDVWKAKTISKLQKMKIGDRPKELIEAISESLLETFRAAPLLDAYDVYQRLTDYWAETMQDDVHSVVTSGWVGTIDGKPNTDLIPQSVVIRRFFMAEQTEIENLEAEQDALIQQIEEIEEEHGVDEGLLADARNEKDKITAKSVRDRLKVVTEQKDADSEERKLLTEYCDLVEREGAANKKLRETLKELEKKVAAKYPKWTEAEIKMLVIDEKWLATLMGSIHQEVDRTSRSLTGRIRELAKRYDTPLSQVIHDVKSWSARVDAHLAKMDPSWK